MSYSANDFYNAEKNRLQQKQQNADEIQQSQERLAQLNDSYRKRYAKYVQILMVLVLAFGIYLAIMVLQKTFPFIPQFAVDISAIVLIFLVAFYLFSAFAELYSRSVMNYDELNLAAYDSSGVDVSNLAAKGQIFDYQGTMNGNVCVGSDCCPSGYNYNASLNRCVVSQVPTTSQVPKQTFTTLEYSKIETAYNNTHFNSADLKRSPNTEHVKPMQNNSVLAFSYF